MKLRVLFFSLLRDIAGADEIELSFEGNISVEVLLETLYAHYPAMRVWDGKVLVAADQEYVDRDVILHGGEEVAIMPPVQGG
ncbi:MAG: MoaD/ThiS family protein [Verrucomicrobiales bacterium]